MAGVLVVGIVAYATRSRHAEESSADLAPNATPVERQEVQVVTGPPEPTGPDYVGPQACVECHANRVAEFQQTKHFHTCRVPTEEMMPAGFEPGQGDFQTRFPGLSFEMTRENGEYLQTSIVQTPDGEQRTTSRIDLVLGAATADDVYLSWHDDGFMYELPMAWLWTSDEWGAAFFDPHGSGDFSRATTRRCIECHNTWFEYVPGSVNQYRRDHFILGVTCERCHGPASDHVAYHRSHPETTTAHGIVNPSVLTRERQIEVCTQCHSNAIKHRGPSFRYRPGESLDEYYYTLSVHRTEDDHVANQIASLRLSACFQNSEMSCITCHDPHVDRNESLSGAASCRQCHQPEHCGERKTIPVAVRDDCIGCHMPPYVKINVNFQTAGDTHVPPIRRYEHRIAEHPVATKTVLMRWYQSKDDEQSRQTADKLADEIVAHWLSEARRHRSDFRFMAVIADLREALRIKDTPELQQRLKDAVSIQTRLDDDYAEAMHRMSQHDDQKAVDLLERILKTKPDHADAHGRLGTLYAQEGRWEQAVSHLEAVAEHDPDSAYGHSMLAWLAYLDGRYDEAVRHYRRADAVEPYNAQIQYQLGLCLMQRGDIAEAVAAFKQSLEINPQRLETCTTLSMVHSRQSEFVQAIAYAERAVEISDQKNVEILMALAQAYAQADRMVEAIDVASRALQVAESQESPLTHQVRRARDLWKAQL